MTTAEKILIHLLGQWLYKGHTQKTIMQIRN